MKTLMSILTITAIAVLYSTGAFVTPSTQTATEFVALTDTDMAQRVGGPWTSELASWGQGHPPECSLSTGCFGSAEVTHDRYRCVPCDNRNDSAYTQIDAAAKTKYWCVFDNWKEIQRCRTESAIIDRMRHCDNYQGACGS